MASFAVFGWFIVQLQAPMIDPHALAPPDEFVQIDGLTVHYVQAGGGDGLPVLLVHGFGGWTEDWAKTIPALARDRPVYALDLPGWGLSDKPADFDYALESQADFVLRFMDHFDLEQVDLVGNSMGGGIAVALSTTHPERVRRLVLIDSVGYRSMLLHTWGNRLARLPFAPQMVKAFLPDFGKVRVVMEWLYGDRGRLSAEAVEAHFKPLQTPGMAEALVQIAKTLQFDSIRDAIPKITQPTLVLWGERDPLLPVANARRFHHEIEGSRLVVFPEAGHVPQMELPDRVNPVLQGFLSD